MFSANKNSLSTGFHEGNPSKLVPFAHFAIFRATCSNRPPMSPKHPEIGPRKESNLATKLKNMMLWGQTKLQRHIPFLCAVKSPQIFRGIWGGNNHKKKPQRHLSWLPQFQSGPYLCPGCELQYKKGIYPPF